jgi:hypothetical protein
MTAPSLHGWSPIRVLRDEQGRWVVEWCRMGEIRFTEPFFSQTIDRALRHPFNRAFGPRTPLDALGSLYADVNARRPDGIIFHVSRCGSTLAAQLLAALPGSTVLSEAQPIDDVLSANARDDTASDAWRVERLRWVVAALANSVPTRRGRFFLKMDAWHAVDLPLIRRAFPGVPSILLYRDPLEVLVSHAREPGWFMVPRHGQRLLALSLDQALALPQAEYRARVIRRLLDAMSSDDDPRGRFVNYSELADAAPSYIPRLFGADVAPDELPDLGPAARRDAKRQHQAFTPDTAEKQHAATAEIRRAADAWARPVYDALELRRAQRAAGPVQSAASNETCRGERSIR